MPLIKEESTEKTVFGIIARYGFTGLFSLALLGVMWLILNQFIAQADCARVSNEKCQVSLVQVTTSHNEAMIELNRTLSNLQNEVSRLARAIEKRSNVAFNEVDNNDSNRMVSN